MATKLTKDLGKFAAGCLAVWVIAAACSSASSRSTTTSSSALASELTGVVCPSVSSCFAVGDYYVNVHPAQGTPDYRTLIERWNGSSWSIVDSPNSAAGTSQLARVSCTSPSSCFAVGFVGPYLQGGRVLIEHWDGSSWSILSPPAIASARSSALHDVSCSTVLFCLAVGQYTDAVGGLHGLIEHWNGSAWRVIPSLHDGSLVAVSCASQSLCFAAGQDYTVRNGHELGLGFIEQWNGSSWANSAMADANVDVEPLALSCGTASRCVVSGLQGKGMGSLPNHTLIEQWNGRSWSIVPSPDPSPPDNWLNGVSCAGASLCVATGSQRSGTTTRTLIEQWDGASWMVARSPNPPTRLNSSLAHVACVSASRCFAVGEYVAASNGHGQTLVERWNGSSWAIVSSPNHGA